MKRSVLAALAALCALLLWAGCAQEEPRPSMTGLCLAAEGGSYLILTEEGEPIVMSNQSGREDLFQGLGSGDRIEVVTDGAVQETYPAQVGVYSCTLLEEGSPEDLPQEVLDALAELDWIPAELEEEDAAAFHPLDQNRDGAVDGADLALSGMSREEFAAALVEQGLTGTLEEAEQVADGLLSVNYAVCNTVPERAQEICGYPPAESAAG